MSAFFFTHVGGKSLRRGTANIKVFITKLPAFDLRAGPIDKGAAGYETFSLRCHGNITEIINYPSGMMDVIRWQCPWQNILLNYPLLVPAHTHVPMIKYYYKQI